MLAAVKKGKPVDEAEIPPPVATGSQSAAPPPSVPARPAPPVPARPAPTAPPDAVPQIITPTSEEEHSSPTTAPSVDGAPSPGESTVEAAQQPQSSQKHGQLSWIT